MTFRPEEASAEQCRNSGVTPYLGRPPHLCPAAYMLELIELLVYPRACRIIAVMADPLPSLCIASAPTFNGTF